MIKIIIIGNLGRDPEMRYTPSGQSVTNFSVASSRKYTTADGEKHEETEWFNASAWGGLADTCNQYLTRGSQVYIEGRLKSRSYTTADGQPRFSNDITITEIQFLGSRSNGNGQPAHAGPMEDIDDLPDDLPF